MIILETARIRVRELGDHDLEHMFKFMSDPDIMRYIRAPDTDRAAVRERMTKWAQYHAEHPKLGVFALETLDTANFAGYCVARHVNFEAGKDLEVGYAVGPEFAGQGLATEVAAGLAAYLFQEFQPEKVVAFTAPENTASQRVLEKSGFQRTGTAEVYDGESVVFELYR